jgi:hypothetical protein
MLSAAGRRINPRSELKPLSDARQAVQVEEGEVLINPAGVDLISLPKEKWAVVVEYSWSLLSS